MKQIVINSQNYPQDTLSGYKTNTVEYNISSILIFPILSYVSFAFMDNKRGQYGTHWDNLSIFLFIGLWCLILCIPSFFIIIRRTKPKIPETSSIFTVSIKDYWSSIKTARKYPNLNRTLIAWFIWSDAENTIGTVGILFAQKELGMNSVELIILLFEIQLLAMIGNVFFIWFENKFNLNAKHLLILHLCINCMLPIWAIIGLLPGSPFGLRYKWEIYVFVGLFYASQLGSLFSSSRSLYGHLVPIGHESKFFGLYELTNKGSSWIGPLISAFIANIGSLRYALIYVLIFYIIAIPILIWGVDYDEGLKQAGKLNKKYDIVTDNESIINENKNDKIIINQSYQTKSKEIIPLSTTK